MKSFFAYAAMAAIAVAADGDTITTMDECFQQINGMTWDWANNVCITYEKNCVENQGGIWQDSGAWGSMTCYMGTPDQECVKDKKFWDQETEKCYETYEELAIILKAREEAACVADGFEWRTLREGDTSMVCYRDEPNQNCEIRGGFLDWVGDKCYDTWDERYVVEQQREEDRCVADGNTWRPIAEGHYFSRCYTGEPGEDCLYDGGYWTDDKCMTLEENAIYYCDFAGETWDENFWGDGIGGCDYPEDYRPVDVEEASEPVAASASLASKKSKAAASSNAGMYAGISFGVIGLVAAGAMFAAATKKQVSDNEEGLLNDNDFSRV